MTLNSSRLKKVYALALLRKMGVPVRSVIDVGVQYSSPDLLEVFPDVPHILFEPIEEYAPHIKYAYRDINHVLLPCAVSDRNGTATLAVRYSADGRAITGAKMILEDIPSALPTRDINTVSLDTWFREEYRGSTHGDFLLKIDVDGIEEAVLRGATDVLPRCSVVVVEASPDDLGPRLKLVSDHGFVLRDIVEPWYENGKLAQVDLILVSTKYKDLRVPADVASASGFGNWSTIE